MNNPLTDASGQVSSMRILNAVIVLTIMGVWAVTSIRTKEMAPLSAESVALVVGALAVKAGQKFGEKGKTDA